MLLFILWSLFHPSKSWSLSTHNINFLWTQLQVCPIQKPVCRLWQFSTRSQVCTSHFLLFYPYFSIFLGLQVTISFSKWQHCNTLTCRTNISSKKRQLLLNSYQLMKELFPAEWFPISITVIFFLGASKEIPTLSAMSTRPTKSFFGKKKAGKIV